MHIAMIGTRGVPARYGGFETAVEEVGCRLVEAGHQVTVYCRGDDPSASYLGMKRVRLPAIKHPAMETLSHTALSVAHLLAHRTDVAIVFNAANAPLLPFIRAARIPVAVHVDGLEWKRAKWGPGGRRYYLAMERLAVRLADELIADAVGIQEYYRDRYNASSVFIPYGAPIRSDAPLERLAELRLTCGAYHLVVARIEPENHVDVIIEGYIRSHARCPLVVVGSVPYPSAHQALVHQLAFSDKRIRIAGSIWDQDLLDALYAGSTTYIHGHSVGGTNPSLLRAMGAGADIVAWDVKFNREVLGGTGHFFGSITELAAHIDTIENCHQNSRTKLRRQAVQRAESEYTWRSVARQYEHLCDDLQASNRPHRIPQGNFNVEASHRGDSN